MQHSFAVRRTAPHALGCAVAAACCAGLWPAVQAQAPTQVSVTIDRVAVQIAHDIGVDVSKVPLNVQVPLETAAPLCRTTVDGLRRELAATGAAQCSAQTTSRELNRHVLSQVLGNNEEDKAD